jgi:hypothetical protein
MPQMPSIPYSSPSMYNSTPGTERLIDLMLRRGDAEARGQAASGAIWGRAVEDIGHTAAQAVAQYGEQKKQAQREELFNQVVQSFDPQNPMAAYRALTVKGGFKPQEAAQAVAGVVSFQTMAQKAQQGTDPTLDEYKGAVVGIGASEKAMPGFVAKHYATLGPVVKRGAELYGPGKLPDNPTPEQLQDITGQVLAAHAEWGTKQPQTPAEAEALAYAHAKGAAAGTPVKPQPTRDVLDTTTGKPAFKSEAEIAAEPGRYQPMRTGVNVNVQAPKEDDAKQAVAGMKEGTIPPQLPGRATKEYVSMMAEARRQGYDLVKANLDWSATTKHIATLNGSQQTRLRQAVDVAYHSLDVIDDLSSKWKGGRFPALNKANLAAAKAGVYGEEVASVARQLEGQITDLTSELGQVFMGGNSPTDHALQLAGKNLSADWSQKVLGDMTALARTNLQIRRNSMSNVGVAGASANNPYDTPAVPAAPAGGPKELTYNPKTGKLE